MNFLSFSSNDDLQERDHDSADNRSESLATFGILITCIGGVIGVSIGAITCSTLRGDEGCRIRSLFGFFWSKSLAITESSSDLITCSKSRSFSRNINLDVNTITRYRNTAIGKGDCYGVLFTQRLITISKESDFHGVAGAFSSVELNVLFNRLGH